MDDVNGDLSTFEVQDSEVVYTTDPLGHGSGHRWLREVGLPDLLHGPARLRSGSGYGWPNQNDFPDLLH